MDLSNPWSQMSGLLLGLIGMGLLMYGNKEMRIAPIAAGLVLCIAPYFVASVVVMWVVAGACFGGLYALASHA
ncbi:MAG: hypothetical protein Q8L55_15680 [Phycisphaerales bacterium]|nr:hypothetical protein [Phycisphaerales bacterium]